MPHVLRVPRRAPEADLARNLAERTLEESPGRTKAIPWCPGERSRFAPICAGLIPTSGTGRGIRMGPKMLRIVEVSRSTTSLPEQQALAQPGALRLVSFCTHAGT